MSTTSPIAPSIGRIVLVNLDESTRPSGPETSVCPGIVTVVHGNNCINVTVFPSNSSPFIASSVCYSEDLSDYSGGPTWHWMDYQLKVAQERDPVSGEPVNTTT